MELKDRIKQLEAENDRLRMLLADSVSEPVTRAADIAKKFIPRLATEQQECFYVLYLDSKNKIIDEIMISKGTLTSSLVHPREVFAPALERRAASIIMLHNHPSGNLDASSQDINITKRISEAGSILGIDLLDHIIIGGKSFYSFADTGRMPVK